MRDTASPSASTRQFLWVLGVAITILCLLIFGGVVSHLFVTLDDLQLIYFNPAAKGPTIEHLTTAFTTFDPELYIPLTIVSYQLEYFFAGTNPSVTHGINLLLHITNAILVGWFVLLVLQKRWVAAVTAILFAVHPLQTEAVAWASARKDVLSAFFFLASCIAYVRIRRPTQSSDSTASTFPILSLLLFFFGLLAKALVLPLPVILLVILWMKKERIDRSTLIQLVPFFALSVVFGIVALFGKHEIVQSLTPVDTLLMAAKSTGFYLKSFFLPTSLAVMYPQSTAITLWSREFALPVILTTVIVIGAFLLRHKTRIALGAVAFFFLLLIPTFVNFAKAGDIYFASDRYVYLPSIAVFLLIASALDWCSKRKQSLSWQSHVRSIVHAIGGSILVIFSLLSHAQAAVWQDSITLFEHSVDKYPESGAAHLNLGVLFTESGDAKRGIEHFEKSLAIRKQSHALTGLASAYHAQGNSKAAIEKYEESIAFDPKDAEPHFGLANLFAEEGNTKRAEEEYNNAIRIDPNYVAAYNNFGALLMSTGDLKNAEFMLMKARDINPSFAKTHFNLGKLYQAQYRNSEAQTSFQSVLVLDPDSVEAMINLAATYVVDRKPEEALSLLKHALALEPDNSDAKALVKEMIRLKMIGEQK